jgi:predicted acylesterase/phospholipase RssA
MTMALKSSTYALQKVAGAKAGAKNKALLARHRNAVEKVVADAKAFSDDRQRKLDTITDATLRQSAAR